MRHSRSIAVLSVALMSTTGLSVRRLFWGEAGHRMTAQAAVAALPAEMPNFFRDAASQLVYLNPEPDRWRERTESLKDPALSGATAPNHFLDLEMIPAANQAGALAAKDRFAFADTLRAHNIDASVAGVLPFAILELTQHLRVSFRQWRAAPNDAQRTWIEARIINDAGILGHYVADGSNPAHTSIHYNGWAGANPNGYATDTRFHGRFESAYVQAKITLGDVTPAVGAYPRVFTSLRSAIVSYFMTTHAEVERLYQLDKVAPFGIDTDAPDSKQFTVTRLAAGATMLRDLWWTAWVTSAPDSSDQHPPR